MGRRYGLNPPRPVQAIILPVKPYVHPRPSWKPSDFFRPVSTRQCGLYFIRSADHVKIGITNDIQKRLTLLQVGNPIDLELVALFDSPAPLSHEMDLHLLLGAYATRGEWFMLPKHIVSMVKHAKSIEQLLADIGNAML
jgi:hypothetical protein